MSSYFSFVATSPDLTSWRYPTTPISTASPSAQLYCVCQGAGILVAGGYDVANPSGPPIIYSTDDGATWTFCVGPTVYPSFGYCTNIAWNGTVFIAVGNFSVVGGGSTYWLTSVDGITWEAVNPVPGVDPYGLIGIVWAESAGVFVAIVRNGFGGNIFWTTSTGASGSWTGLGPSGGTAQGPANAIGWSGSLLIGGRSTNAHLWSSDLVTVTNVSIPEVFTAYGIVWGGGLWIVVGTSTGHNMLSSPDGVTWTDISATTPFSAAGSVFGVNYGDGVFLALADGSGGTYHALASTPNGSTWTAHSSPFDTGFFPTDVGGPAISAVWTGTRWVVVGVFESVSPPPPPPPTTAYNRMYPRDDKAALGTVRQKGGRGLPTSLQNSHRQGSRGTYALV